MANRRTRGEVDPEDKKKVTREGLREISEIFRYILPYKGYFVLGMIFLVLSTATTFGFVTFLKDLIDPAVDQSPEWISQLQTVSIYLALILFAQAVFSFLRIYLFAQVSERALADIRLDIYRRLVTFRIPFFDKRRVGELISRITADVAQLQGAMSVTLAEFIRQIATFVIGTVILFSVSGKLTLVMMSTFPVMIVCAILLGRVIRKLSRTAQDELAQSNVIVDETLQSIRTVKAFTNEMFEVMRYRKSIGEVVMYGIKAARARGLFVSFLIMAVFGGITLVVWYGVSLVGHQEITIGTLVYFIMITLFIGGSVAGLGDMYGQLQKTIGASQRIREILREEVEFELSAEEEGKEMPAIEGSVQFENVHFSYPTRPDVPVLQGIDFTINPGQKIALVGHSGAGKSTIAQLILGFYEVNDGKIRVDGNPQDTYAIQKLRRNMAMVPQEVILFGGSIRENISYGRPGASEQELINAARRANAMEFIETFPDGLDTIVGDRGIKLSGGQRQRIAIARAILNDPAILILDEATSSLDAESEHLVQGALNELMQGRTTIVIAHRLSTIRQVDRIFVMDGGRIIETGTHDELSRVPGGIYANLLQLQFQV